MTFDAWPLIIPEIHKYCVIDIHLIYIYILFIEYAANDLADAAEKIL